MPEYVNSAGNKPVSASMKINPTISKQKIAAFRPNQPSPNDA